MHLQACRILEIIGLESDLYSKIKGHFGAHDFGAKHHGRDFKLTRSCTPLTLESSFSTVTRACCEHWSTQKTEETWKNMWNSSRSLERREMCLGIGSGHWPLITEVTQPVGCTSNQCVSSMGSLKPQGIPWKWHKLTGNWSYANKGKGSTISMRFCPWWALLLARPGFILGE